MPHGHARALACAAWIAAFAAVAVVPRAAADEVRLLNGDRISGKVQSKSGERVVVRTQSAGEVSVRWRDVASIATDAPVDLMLRERKERLRGKLVPGDERTVLVENESGARRTLAMDEVDFINPKRHESGDGATYTGRVAFSAAESSGNVDSKRLYSDAQLAARALEYGWGLTAKVERRDELGLGANTAWLLGGNYDRFLGPTQFAYVRGSVERDRAKDIDQRSTFGVGYGVHLFDTPAAKLTVRAGVDQVVVDRFAAASERYPALGWGIKATFVPWSARVEIFHEQDGFLNLEDTGTVILRSRTGVRVPLVARLNATAQVNVDWERTPAPERVPTDRTLLLGVDYTF
jgi:putative salt-induced outer membrane protein YdiY